MKNKKETTKNKDLPIPKMNFEKAKIKTEELKETLEKETPSPKISTAKEVYNEFERRDELAIENDLTEEPFYEKIIDEKYIYGISIVGVFDIIRDRGGFGVIEMPHISYHDRLIIASVMVKDFKKDIINTGTSQQYQYKGGKLDNFAHASVTSKAKRNAFRPLLDPEMINAHFEKWYKAKYGVKDIDYKNILVVGENVKINDFLNQNKKQ